MTRTVKDAAILLDTLVGYDSTDPFTAASLYAKDAGNYVNGLNNNVTKGTRIGILREAFGSEDNPESAQVNEVVNKAIALMEEAGVTVIDPITIPDLQKYNEETALYLT
ncbi:amidase family protein, partial [Micrococcus sp. SIMBA_144]